MANLFVLDSDRHESALSHWRRCRRDGVVSEEEMAEHEALLARNLAEAEDAADQNYVARAVLSNGTDTEHVRSLLRRRWERKRLIVIEGGQRGNRPEAA